MKLALSGVIPAALTPFQADHSIDVDGLTRHLSGLSRTPGVTGILVNGNTSEVGACSADEQRQVLLVAKSAVGTVCAVLSGIQLTTAHEVRASAAEFEALGADGFVVYPPVRVPGSSNAAYAETVLSFWSALASATKLPLIHFQYPASSGRGYSMDTIESLADRIQNFAAIKDFCSDEELHRELIVEFKERRGIPVLTSHTRWLVKSLEMGASGIFSSAGAVFAKQQAELLAEFTSNDQKTSRAVILGKMMAALSANTLNEQVAKLKVAARLRGDFSSLTVRPPCSTVSIEEIASIESKLAELAYL